MLTGANDSVTNKQLLDEILRSRNELKNSIEASEARLLLKIESANFKINTLEKENTLLKEKVERLENESRRKNIVLFGLKRPEGIISPEFICGKLNSLLAINLTEEDINDIYLIGKTQSCPIKVKFSSYFKKILVLQNSKKLKGTEISISNDLSVQQRQANKVLRRHLALARLDGKNNNCYIRNNKLFVDDTSYTAEELEGLNAHVNTEPKSNSTPSTPNSSSSTIGNKATLRQETVSKPVNPGLEIKSADTQKKIPGKQMLVAQNQKFSRNTRANSSSSIKLPS